MSEKVKVNKRVFKALEQALRISSKEELLEDHTRGGSWSSDEFIVFNDLSNWEMANILINGYEVEETPEEVIRRKYLLSKGNAINNGSAWDLGFVYGINFLLKTMDMKIKGIDVNGYEVQGTPEQELSVYFDKLTKQQDEIEFGSKLYVELGIEIRTIASTLKMLNIKIKGINE